MSRAVYPCSCGELLYAEAVKGEMAMVVRHGEDNECVRVFSRDDIDMAEKMAVWYEELHGLRKERTYK